MGNTPNVRFKGFTEDWEQRKLGELASSFEYGLNAAAKEYDGENKYIRITDIDDNTHEFLTDNLTSPDIELTGADNYKLTEGDILFARTGASVGKSYIYKNSDGLVYYAGFLIRARIKEEYDTEFVFQNTLTDRYNKYIAVTSQRSGQPGVNAQEYAEFEIKVPKKEEQTKIGTYFRNIDNLITLHQQKCAEIKELKKYMLQNMFPQKDEKVPKIRFAGFTGDWEQRKLSEISDFITKGATPTTYGYDWQESGIPFFRNDAIKDNKFSYGDFSYISEEANEALQRSEIHGDDILVAITGDIGKAGIVPKSIEKGNINQHTARVRIIKDAIPYFVYQSLITDKQQKKYQLIKTGLSMPQLSLQQIRDTIILCPSVEEQSMIGECFINLDNLITLHQQKCNALKEFKKYMLQNMFPQKGENKCQN